ncbi:hypothetical protein WA556_006021 [Blastocystis sp. ATCC 50177/Nand II]
MENIESVVERAQFLRHESPRECVAVYSQILDYPNDNETVVKVKETCTLELAEVFGELKDIASLSALLESSRNFFTVLSKAKAAKIVKSVIEIAIKMDVPTSAKIELCEKNIKWCEEYKLVFLSQRLRSRLAYLLYMDKQYRNALNLCGFLLRELARIDDKSLTMEVHITEARVYKDLNDITKAKSSLTACKMAATSIYVDVPTQAEIDLLSGEIYSYQHDFQSAFSFFFEAFDALTSLKDARASTALKYMVLMKILSGKESDIQSVFQNHLVVENWGPNMAVLRRVADAFQKRDLHMLRAVLQEEPAFFEDEVVRFHMRFLSNELMEKNFLKIVEPYDVVEIGFVARKMELPEEEIVRKLSQMILDKKLSASLDQGKGLLIMLPSASQHVLAENVLSTITELNEVVDALKVRADTYNAKLQEM